MVFVIGPVLALGGLSLPVSSSATAVAGRTAVGAPAVGAGSWSVRDPATRDTATRDTAADRPARATATPATAVSDKVVAAKLVAAKLVAAKVVAAKVVAANRPARSERLRAGRSASRQPVRTSKAWFRPSVGPLSSRYGWRWGRPHVGIDIAAERGSPVLAVGSGVVVVAEERSGYGRLITIRHTDGTETSYAHMSEIRVGLGPVRAGRVIALVGSSGYSTGPHLHFEVRVGGVPTNPLPWLRARGIIVS